MVKYSFKVFFIVFLVGLFFEPKIALAQKTFGFEWVRPYQPYLKIKLAATGLFRIDSATLANYANKDPRRLQVFKDGIELPIYISGEGDGVFNALDYLEFFAEPNSGDLDKELYRNPIEQPQTFRSLFSDTACFFITWLPDTAVSTALRMVPFLDSDYSNYLPEPIYTVTRTVVPQEEYYYGVFLPSEQKYYLSDYGDAEGMMSSLIGPGGTRYFTFQTPNKVANQVANMEVKVIGASDFFLANPSAPNHHVKVWVIQNNGTPVNLVDTLFRGYGERKFIRNIPFSLIGDSTQIVVEVVNDLGIGSDYVGVSYVQLSYKSQNQLNSPFAKLELNSTSTLSKDLIQFTSYAGTQPIIWDLTNKRRTVGLVGSSKANALLPHAFGNRVVVIQESSSIQPVLNPIPVVISIPNAKENYQFLLVSNRQLQSVAESYESYRSQKYKTHLAYIEDLANTYTFGHFHPLAIKRFCAHLYADQNTPPEFLLLLGRGYQHNLLKANSANNALNLVPAIGVPSSDNLFTNGFTGATGAPAIATGRIPASNVNEANNYLQKLKLFETGADSIQLWKKSYLHLSGGSDRFEQNDFKAKLDAMARLVKDKPIGASVQAYFKNSTLPTDGDLKKTLLKELNDGVSLMTFYGHGSLTVLDMDFGGINDLLPTNRNAFYYFNGCNIGNANDVDPLGSGLVYGKDYICADNKGAIGWLAHTNLTFTDQLDIQMGNLYEQMSKVSHGLPIGIQLKKAIENSAVNSNAYARSHGLQLLLQGDPALVLYSPSKPDYQIASEDLFVTPSNASVQNDSFAIGIIIKNLARAQADSINIDVKRKLPDNSELTYQLLIPSAPFHTDTFYVWIKPLTKKDIGSNSFTVQINANKKVDELSYLNNEANLTYFLPGSGLQALLPQPYAIVSTDTVTLWVQNNNLFVQQAEYVFEIDTNLLFSPSSPLFASSGVIASNHLAKINFPIKGIDSTVYYWRARLNLPENEGGNWVTQSFIYLKNGPEGWQQQAYNQIKNPSAKTFIQFNDSLKKIEFSNNELVLGIEDRRWDHRGMGVIIPYLLNAGVGTCISQGTVVLVFEPFQVDYPYELPNYPFNCAFVQANKNNQSIRYYPFNTNTLQGEADMARLIDSVPNGYFVAMFSRYKSNIQNWQPETKNLFSKIGSNKVENVKSDNTAWAVIGKKGEQVGLAAEDTIINNELENPPNLPPAPTDPQDEKRLRVRRSILMKWFEGNFTSSQIGPAAKFYSVKLSLNTGDDPLPFGRWWLSVLGLNQAGKDTVLIQNLTASEIDISTIDTKKYPYIKLRLNFVDSTYRTPHQLHFWQVSFDPGPEFTVDINQNYAFHADELEEGDSIMLQLPILNLSKSNFDTTLASIELKDENRFITQNAVFKVPPLGSGQTYLLNTKLPTKNLRGKNEMQVFINSGKKPEELNYLNNYFRKSFLVKTDTKNPFLDVTFDDQRIMNGDIVSAKPVIKISSTDQNKFLTQTDTSTFELWLRKPKQFEFERIYMNDSRLQFVSDPQLGKAELIFEPGLLADGLYTLKAQSKDASGNLAGANDFEIDFTIINKSTITHFYPYPNPFTTSMRFVFTLTGSKIPDQLMIRILTVNGKIVREVSKEEFGPIHIGNNISEFAWNGTDMFGDRLANGVYLYQVFTKVENQNIENRATKAKEESSFFINGTGKIFIMR